jgi:hypothetical protein
MCVYVRECVTAHHQQGQHARHGVLGCRRGLRVLLVLLRCLVGVVIVVVVVAHLDILRVVGVCL